MGKVWVVVAESSRARLLEASGLRAPLRELEAMVQPRAQAHGPAMIDGVASGAHDRTGEGHLSADERARPKANAAQAFAREIAAKVDAGRKRGRFDTLVLVAPPRFLGLLRQELPPEARRRVQLEVHKELVTHSVSTIRNHVAAA